MVKNEKDFWSGVLFVSFGVLFLVWSGQYTFGSPSRMGPGFFPSMLAILMIALGAVITLGAVFGAEHHDHVEPFGWRGLLVVLGSVLAFAGLLNTAGFIIAVTVLIIGSATASRDFALRETLISAVVLVISSYLIFVLGLELQFPVWPPAFTE